jgi:hypothetical protein
MTSKNASVLECRQGRRKEEEAEADEGEEEEREFPDHA